MAYELHDMDDGTFELVEIVRDVIATFNDRIHAEHYYRILVEADEAAPAAVAQASEQEPSEPASAAFKTARDPAPEPAAAEADWSEPSDDEWLQAFVALSGGADLKEVANDLNVNFYKLRGKYASYCRRLNAEAASEPPVEQTATDLDECRLCGREFKATAESGDLCARCSRG